MDDADDDINFMLGRIRIEYLSAREKHAPFASRHEGYAVLLEEVDELWAEIKQRYPDPVKLRAEAIQVAAMALAIILET